MKKNELLAILKRFFDLKETADWVALDEMGLRGYRTVRVGKVQDDVLCFTIGTTNRGKTVELDDWIRSRISSEGLPLREIQSKSGNRRKYVGFEWRSLTPPTIERIIRNVLDEVRARA